MCVLLVLFKTALRWKYEVRAPFSKPQTLEHRRYSPSSEDWGCMAGKLDEVGVWGILGFWGAGCRVPSRPGTPDFDKCSVAV